MGFCRWKQNPRKECFLIRELTSMTITSRQRRLPSFLQNVSTSSPPPPCSVLPDIEFICRKNVKERLKNCFLGTRRAMVYLNERINHLSNKYGLNSQYFNPEISQPGSWILNLLSQKWNCSLDSWAMVPNKPSELVYYSLLMHWHNIPQIYPQPSTTVYCVGGPKILPFLSFR